MNIIETKNELHWLENKRCDWIDIGLRFQKKRFFFFFFWNPLNVDFNLKNFLLQ